MAFQFFISNTNSYEYFIFYTSKTTIFIENYIIKVFHFRLELPELPIVFKKILLMISYICTYLQDNIFRDHLIFRESLN